MSAPVPRGKQEPDDVDAGTLEVGTTDRFEVVINLGHDATGHIVFSPRQARHLANLLMKHAVTAAEAWRKANKR